MTKKIFFGILFIGLIISCQKEDKKEKEISQIPISFHVERFDQQFAKATPEDLPELTKQYPFLFPKRINQSIWIEKMSDSIQQEINNEVTKKFPDFDTEKEDLHKLFQHMKFYYPSFKTPRVITLTSDVDYRHSVVVTDSLVLIGLDNYLGEDHKFYRGIQRYFSKTFIPSQIVPDVARKYAKNHVPKPDKRSLLAYMVYYGKIKYFEKLMLPDRPESDIMSYTTDEMDWADENEREIWGYFVESDLLYKTSPDLRKRFFDLGPFTKFGLQLDNESPSQLGKFIGLRIVEQFIEKHKDVTLQELLQIENETIFNESNYKPNK